jgi:CcmD family protein
MEQFFQQNQMYVVLTVVMLIWAGIVFYLWRMDKKIDQLEQKIKKG